MKNKTIRLAPLFALTLVCFLACQAQIDTVVNKEELIKAVSADPLLADLQAISVKRKDLIANGNVDLDATSAILESSSQHPCDLTVDISHVKGAASYVKLLCEYVTIRQALYDKYSDLSKLTLEERVNLLNAKSRISEDEAEELIRLRLDR